jgi:ubiquitin carboxyl-terminal hydrolase 4/11/15
MDASECFAMCFPGLKTNAPISNESEGFSLKDKPYTLHFKNISGTWSNCEYCNQTKCSGCPVPFTDEITIGKILDNIKQDSANSFYNNNLKVRGKELILQAVWHDAINKGFFSYLSTAVKFEVDPNAVTESRQADIQLTDCLKEFKRTELLDEDNKWYCNKCKDHVQASKTLEIFRVPRILVISLKRFKASRSKYGMGGFGGQKLDLEVNFPLEGLDMAPFVLSETQKKTMPLIYDCFAVSNHYGSAGFGHYTAYAKNPFSKTWYNFDDSSVSQVSGKLHNITGSAAYNLFYRRRDADN